jgi:hypothetical protein
MSEDPDAVLDALLEARRAIWTRPSFGANPHRDDVILDRHQSEVAPQARR